MYLNIRYLCMWLWSLLMNVKRSECKEINFYDEIWATNLTEHDLQEKLLVEWKTNSVVELEHVGKIGTAIGMIACISP
jgi:hypothetical protein